MSLINDALKRAKQTHDRHPRPVFSDPPLQPVADRAAAYPFSFFVIGGAACLTLLLACWFLTVWWRGAHQLAPASRAQVFEVKQAAVIAPSSPFNKGTDGNSSPLLPMAGKAPLVLATPAPVPVTNAAATVAVAAIPAPTPLVIVPEPAPAAPSAEALAAEQILAGLKLQGIFYRLSNASILINGHTLFLNDEIDHAKVVSIDRQSVHMLIAGKVHVLKLR